MEVKRNSAFPDRHFLFLKHQNVLFYKKVMAIGCLWFGTSSQKFWEWENQSKHRCLYTTSVLSQHKRCQMNYYTQSGWFSWCIHFFTFLYVCCCCNNKLVMPAPILYILCISPAILFSGVTKLKTKYSQFLLNNTGDEKLLRIQAHFEYYL